jgi:Protein of unknown function (DUF2934)
MEVEMPRSLKTGKSPAKRTTKLRETAADVQAIAAPSHADIATRAYERFLQRGGQHGQDFEDWLTAERELQL